MSLIRLLIRSNDAGIKLFFLLPWALEIYEHICRFLKSRYQVSTKRTFAEYYGSSGCPTILEVPNVEILDIFALLTGDQYRSSTSRAAVPINL